MNKYLDSEHKAIILAVGLFIFMLGVFVCSGLLLLAWLIREIVR